MLEHMSVISIMGVQTSDAPTASLMQFCCNVLLRQVVDYVYSVGLMLEGLWPWRTLLTKLTFRLCELGRVPTLASIGDELVAARSVVHKLPGGRPLNSCLLPN